MPNGFHISCIQDLDSRHVIYTFISTQPFIHPINQPTIRPFLRLLPPPSNNPVVASLSFPSAHRFLSPWSLRPRNPWNGTRHHYKRAATGVIHACAESTRERASEARGRGLDTADRPHSAVVPGELCPPRETPHGRGHPGGRAQLVVRDELRGEIQAGRRTAGELHGRKLHQGKVAKKRSLY